MDVYTSVSVPQTIKNGFFENLNTYDYISINLNPDEILFGLSTIWNVDFNSHEFSLKLDKSNIWPTYKDKFEYPKLKHLPRIDLTLVNDPEKDCIYLCGNSLGILPKASRHKVSEQFDKWSKMGVYGYVEGDVPWLELEYACKPLMAQIVGASNDEVHVMNFLTVNLHLLMVSFYEPTKKRYKILIEDKSFPSDHYAVESHIKLHDLKPEECMIMLKPREGEYCLRTEDIIKTLEDEGEQIALVMLSGIQYYTGQFFQIKEITEAAHNHDCLIGWDLAHAVGNVELKLHDWNVDFAVWCTYKYLNSGPGGIGAMFLHEKHFDLKNKKKLDGWWSHRLETRFKMDNKIEHPDGAAAYIISTAPVILYSSLLGSLELFDMVGMKALRKKSKMLTGYLELLILDKFKNLRPYKPFVILTPNDPEQRGAQLSLKFSMSVNEIHSELDKIGIVCDYRRPDVLRFSPAPLYNTFNDIYILVDVLFRLIKEFCYLELELAE